jgi:hypothetical protein
MAETHSFAVTKPCGGRCADVACIARITARGPERCVSRARPSWYRFERLREARMKRDAIVVDLHDLLFDETRPTRVGLG